MTTKETRSDNDLPAAYAWLKSEPGPRIILEALHCYGTLELPGEANNPLIIEWAKEVGGWIGTWYHDDYVPWCGLFMAICAKRAGFPHNQKALSAASWATWGAPADHPALGDVLVFARPGGGHVGLYVGEDRDCYHVLGGNQSDMVCIARIRKDRLVAARRCDWHIGQPDNVRKIILKPEGAVSANEA